MELFASILNGRYVLSSNGYVVPQQGRRKFKRLYGTKDTSGYIILGLEIKSKIQKKIKMHRLIAEYFIPNPENKPFINHINGITDDNRIENLEWCTHKENMIHSGKVLKTTSCVMLSRDIVIEMRDLYSKGMTVKEIMNKFPLVKYTAIYNAIVGKSWKNI